MAHLDRPLILFDGICGLCNFFVDFLMKIDSKNHFYFTPLQGETAQKHFQKNELYKYDSIALFYNEEFYYKSDAILKIFILKASFWKLFAVFYILPSAFRDFIYDLIAKKRYTLFGKKESCRFPTKEERAKLLP